MLALSLCLVGLGAEPVALADPSDLPPQDTPCVSVNASVFPPEIHEAPCPVLG